MLSYPPYPPSPPQARTEAQVVMGRIGPGEGRMETEERTRESVAAQAASAAQEAGAQPADGEGPEARPVDSTGPAVQVQGEPEAPEDPWVVAEGRDRTGLRGVQEALGQGAHRWAPSPPMGWFSLREDHRVGWARRAEAGAGAGAAGELWPVCAEVEGEAEAPEGSGGSAESADREAAPPSRSSSPVGHRFGWWEATLRLPVAATGAQAGRAAPVSREATEDR